MDSNRLLSFKDLFTYSGPLFKEIVGLSMYQMNIPNILCLMFKCRNKTCPKTFEDVFTLPPKRVNISYREAERRSHT